MSYVQAEHDKQTESGFLLPLLSTVASAVKPSLASYLSDKIRGKGLYVKHGRGIGNIKQLREGLYIEP